MQFEVRHSQRPYVRIASLVTMCVCAVLASSTSAQGVWEPIGPRGASVISMGRDPFDPGVVFAGTLFGGLYKSTNGGITWNHLPSPFSSYTVFTIAPDPATPGSLYVGTYQLGVFHSVDGGTTWTEKSAGLTDTTVSGLTVLESTGTLLAATFSGVFRSVDSGASWEIANADVPHLVAKTFFVDPGDPGNVYLTTSGLGIYVSENDGQSWGQLQNGLTDTVTHHIIFPPADDDKVWVTTDVGVWRIGIDDFRTGTGVWEDVSFNLTDHNVGQGIHVEGREPIVGDGLTIYEFNGSDAWTTLANRKAWLMFSTPGGEFIHIGGTSELFELTGDLGMNFYPVNWGMQNRFVGALAVIDVFGWWVMYAGTDIGVEFTSNYFSNEPGPPPWLTSLRFEGAIFDIVSDPSQSGTLYAGTERGGVWKTPDFGKTWWNSSIGMVPRRINSLAQASTDSQVLYAGTGSGFYVSRDGGQTWFNHGNKETPRVVTAISVQRETDLVAVYGTGDGHVFRTFDAGDNFVLAWPGNGEPIRSISIAPFVAIYLSTESGHSYLSTDNGTTFVEIPDLGGEYVSAFAVDPVRPWIAYAATFFGGVRKTESAGIEWESVNNGITQLIVISIANSRSNDQLIYAGSLGAVYRTMNAGLDWESASDGLPSGPVTRLYVSPADDMVVYATINEEKVYRTTNGGESWSLFYAPSAPAGTLPIIEDESDPTRLYAGPTGLGVQRSVDGGQNWESKSQGINLFVRTIAAPAAEPGTVYAASLSDGVFKSQDSGETWAPTGLSDRSLFKVVVDPVDSNIVYAGTSRGISRSTDGGTTWSDLGQLMLYYFDLFVDPANPDRLFGGGLGGTLVGSTDAAVSWNHLSKGLPQASILCLTGDDSGLLFAAPEANGVFVSSDSGQTWVRPSEALNGLQITRLLAAQNGTLFAGSQKHRLLMSPDAGVSWLPAALNLDAEYVSDVVESPSNPDLLFVATRSPIAGNRPVFRSTDGGETWVPSSNGIVDTSIVAIAFADTDQELFAASDTRVYHSIDMGDSWTPLDPIGDGSLTDVLVGLTDPDLVLAATNPSGIYRSVDAGQTWDVVEGTESIAVNRLAWGENDLLFAGTLGSGLITSHDLGLSWSPGADPGMINSLVLALAVNPADPDILYAATGGNGVHKSIDGGAVWAAVNDGLGDAKLLALLLDPDNPDTLYAGTVGDGVMVTEDGGESWAPMNDGLFNKTITSLAFNPTNPSLLIAGTEGGGTFQIVR